eukprot:CAMPEP_0198504180 /NCGR_PEP_ID=MMETSP1462-20131121/10352_1 /TAXON_ID=1333877 /ORGANISM="Brandtodinium nutriculum, Strain RCC3387" /LENGTH=35 /DNA_ID= /DNA_START= /DNA_END= /DNA_ORIENTATION=
MAATPLYCASGRGAVLRPSAAEILRSAAGKKHGVN